MMNCNRRMQEEAKTRCTIPAKCEPYFSHEADIGIIGRGKTEVEAFVSAAESMFAIMTDLASIEAKNNIAIEFVEADVELAFITWLNLLLAEARHHGLILGRFALTRHNDHWQGQAWGEPWREDMQRGTEVKGATLTMLSVAQQNDQLWEARCVVDV